MGGTPVIWAFRFLPGDRCVATFSPFLPIPWRRTRLLNLGRPEERTPEFLRSACYGDVWPLLSQIVLNELRNFIPYGVMTYIPGVFLGFGVGRSVDEDSVRDSAFSESCLANSLAARSRSSCSSFATRWPLAVAIL